MTTIQPTHGTSPLYAQFSGWNKKGRKMDQSIVRPIVRSSYENMRIVSTA